MENMEDDNMDDDTPFDEEEDLAGEGTGDPLTCLISFKKKVVDILEENNLDKLRAAKMEIIDFLSLLSLFNSSGIHFS